jgi:hypothetical protein
VQSVYDMEYGMCGGEMMEKVYKREEGKVGE